MATLGGSDNLIPAQSIWCGGGWCESTLRNSCLIFYIHSTWLKGAYINPFSNGFDIGTAMKHQAFDSKLHLTNDNMSNTII
jgi:hypothetical protein